MTTLTHTQALADMFDLDDFDIVALIADALTPTESSAMRYQLKKKGMAVSASAVFSDVYARNRYRCAQCGSALHLRQAAAHGADVASEGSLYTVCAPCLYEYSRDTRRSPVRTRSRALQAFMQRFCEHGIVPQPGLIEADIAQPDRPHAEAKSWVPLHHRLSWHAENYGGHMRMLWPASEGTVPTPPPPNAVTPVTTASSGNPQPRTLPGRASGCPPEPDEE